MPSIDTIATVLYIAFTFGLPVWFRYLTWQYPEVMQRHANSKRALIGVILLYPMAAFVMAVVAVRYGLDPYLHLIFMVLLSTGFAIMGKTQEDAAKRRAST